MRPEALPIAPALEHYGADLTHVPERGWRSVKCCFHDDRHASARVNLEKGGFACLACGVKGNAITIIMNQEGLGYRDALTFASDVLGQSVGQVPRPAQRRQPSRWRDQLFPESRDRDDAYSR